MANQTQNLAAILQNYDHVLQTTNTALNSAGSAAQENSKYMDSLEAKVSNLSATFEELSNNVISSDLVKGLLDIANGLLQIANTPVGQAITQFVLLSGVFTGLIGVIGPIIGKISGVFKALAAGGGIIKGITSAFSALKVALTGGAAGFGAIAAAAAPVAAIIAGVAVGVGLLTKAYDEATISLEEQIDIVNSYQNELSNLKSEYESLASADNLSAADQERLSVLKAQIAANEVLLKQEAQKQLSMQFGEESKTSGALEGQTERYNELGKEIEEVQNRLENANKVANQADFGSKEWQAAQQDIQKYTDELNKLQQTQSALSQTEGKEYTGTERLADKIGQLESYNTKISENNKSIIELGGNAERNAKQIEDLGKANEELQEKASALNGEIAEEVKTLQSLKAARAKLTDEQQRIIDSYLQLTETANSTESVLQSMQAQMITVAGTPFKPKDADSMDEWLKNIEQADFDNILIMLEGMGAAAGDFTQILSQMDSDDVTSLATQAVKNFYGVVDEVGNHMSEFEKALQKDYTESITDVVTVMDYIQQSQTNGIKNWEAYEAALESYYGTADEALIKAQEANAAISKAFNTAGTTQGNFKQYFEGNTFLATRFRDQLIDLATTQESALQGIVSGQKNAEGVWEFQIDNIKKLNEVLGLTEPQLMSMFDYLGSVADINIAEPIDAAHAALQDLKSNLESAKLDIEVTDSTQALEQASSLISSIEDAIGEGAVTLEVDTGNSVENLATLQETAQNLKMSLTEDGEWDFSGLANQIKESMGDLGDDVEIDVDTGNINFRTEEAAEEFGRQFEAAFAGIDTSTMYANLFTDIDMSGANDAAQKVVDQFASAANAALNSTNIAWAAATAGAADDLGAQIQGGTEAMNGLTSAGGEAKKSVEDLNGVSLSKLTTGIGSVSSRLGSVSRQASNVRTQLNSLTSGTWNIKLNTVKLPGGASARGHKGYAMGKQPDGAEYLRADSNGKDLVGEEGEELLVGADGRQRMVGQNGPEFINVNRGDTIIPANVTRMMKNKQIRAFAGGITGATAKFNTNNIANPVISVTSAYSGKEITSISSSSTATNANAKAKSNLAKASKEASKASDELTDALKDQKEAFDEQNEIFEHQIFLREKNGASYEELIKLNRDYQKQIHEQAEYYRKQGLAETSEEIRELQKLW